MNSRVSPGLLPPLAIPPEMKGAPGARWLMTLSRRSAGKLKGSAINRYAPTGPWGQPEKAASSLVCLYWQ
jgi:hypothetical protein